MKATDLRGDEEGLSRSSYQDQVRTRTYTDSPIADGGLIGHYISIMGGPSKGKGPSSSPGGEKGLPPIGPEYLLGDAGEVTPRGVLSNVFIQFRLGGKGYLVEVVNGLDIRRCELGLLVFLVEIGAAFIYVPEAEFEFFALQLLYPILG